MGDRPFTQALRAGQGWRAAEGTRVALVARVASSVRIVQVSTEHRPRGHDVGRNAQQDVQGECDAQR
jgi:hypothetical protein